MRVLIVGAGIAGLALAALLARAGRPATVLEREAAPDPGGAGIQLSPNATKVLGGMDVLAEIRERAVRPEGITLLDGRDNRLLSRFELGNAVEDRYGSPYLLCARAALRDVLARAAGASTLVEYGRPLEGLETRPDCVVARYGSRERPFDVVVGADGVNSGVRRFVRSARVPQATGFTAWRKDGTREKAAAETLVRLMPYEHRIEYPIGERTNAVWLRREGERGPEGDWTPWIVREIASGSSWSDGRIVLIGDAAHAMAPYAAQGGALALEDAAVLAAMLSSGRAVEAALAGFVEARRGRVEQIARLTTANRRIYHANGLRRLARNLAMRVAPQHVLQARMAFVYGWTPPDVIRSRAPMR